MRRLLLIFLLLATSPAMAFQARPCAEKVWLKKGLFRKYDVKYSTIEFISFKTSTDEGSMKASSASSTQGSTMSLDPGITTGQSESSTQFSSTYGDCSIWANNDQWLRRESYVAENMGSLRNDAARGEGEYLDSFMFLSGCPATSKSQFSKLLHENYSVLFNSDEDWGFASDVDVLVKHDSGLSAACNGFPTST